MTTPRAKMWIRATVIALALIVTVAVAGELVARSALASRVADLGAAPGVSTVLSGRSALLQLAGGRIEIELAISDSAMSRYANCRKDNEIVVRAEEGGLIVTTERTIRGVTLPVEVTLVPRRDGGGWALVADSVSAAGISLPAERALKVLAGGGAEGSKAGTRLLRGIPLPGDERLAVSSVSFADGATLLTANAAIDRTGDREGGDGLGGLLSCPSTQEG